MELNKGLQGEHEEQEEQAATTFYLQFLKHISRHRDPEPQKSSTTNYIKSPALNHSLKNWALESFKMNTSRLKPESVF